VLIVDDNVRILRGLDAVLRRKGFTPVACGSSAEALSALKHRKTAPLAAVLDVWLDRGTTGFDVAHECRSRFAFATSMMLMSGYDTAGSEVRSRAESLELQVVVKPVDIRVISRFLAQAVALRTSERGPGVQNAVTVMVERFTLSPQETRILALLLVGVRRDRLVDALGTSSNTVKSQVRSLLRKTGASTCSGLVSIVLADVLKNAYERKLDNIVGD
jgi:FixJ family two-component response regulator